MFKLILKVIIVLISILGLGILGWLIGAYIGGNVVQDFIFNGVRGYEATGQLGSIVGSSLGFILSIFAMFLRSKENEPV